MGHQVIKFFIEDTKQQAEKEPNRNNRLTLPWKAIDYYIKIIKIIRLSHKTWSNIIIYLRVLWILFTIQVNTRNWFNLILTKYNYK